MEVTPNEHELWAAAGGLEASYLADPALREGRRTVVPSDPAPDTPGTGPALMPEARALWVTRWDSG
jgi:hypothetical protein